MKQIMGLAAIGCSLPLVEAGGFRWNSDKAYDLGGYLAPAHETGDLQMRLQPVAAHPEPTSPPELKRSKVQIAERRDSTVPGSVCGYMSHDLDSTLACAYDNTCLFTTFGNSWVAGCCPTTSTDCAIATTCVDSSVGESMSYIGISTYWCSSASFPVCVTLSFQDVPGYTIYNCGGSEVITSQSIDHSLDPSDTTTSSTSTTKSTSTSTSSSDDSGTATAASASGSTGTKPATPTTASPTPAPKSSTPIGAIVGGVVGGVAVIALLILGIVLILRKSGKKHPHDPHPGGYPNQPAPPPPPTHPQPPVQQAPPMHQGPPMQHGPPPPFAAALDNRYSMQKPAYDVNTQSVYAPTLSTPGSPPPPQSPSPGPPGVIQGHPPTTGSPPPQQGPGLSPADSTFPVPQQNTGGAHALHNQHSQSNVPYYEMAATRPDGELRELA